MPVSKYYFDPLTSVRRRRTNPPGLDTGQAAGVLNSVTPPNPVKPPSLEDEYNRSMLSQLAKPPGAEDKTATGLGALNRDVISGAQSALSQNQGDVEDRYQNEYNKALERYSTDLQDRAQAMKLQSIGRGTFTAGGELDTGLSRAYNDIYAKPLGQTTTDLSIAAAQERWNRQLGALNAAQGVSTAQSQRELAAAQEARAYTEGEKERGLKEGELSLRGAEVAGGYYDADGNWVNTESARQFNIGAYGEDVGRTSALPGAGGGAAGTAGKKTLAQQNLEFQQALDRAKVTGTLVDPVTSKDVQTLEAELARGQAAEAKRQFNISQYGYDPGDTTTALPGAEGAAAKPAPTTLASRELDAKSADIVRRYNLDVDKFKQSQYEYEKNTAEAMRQFKTIQAGYILDDNGNPISKADGTPLTTLEAQKIEQAKKEFNARIDEEQYRFDIESGLSQKQIDATERMAIAAQNLQTAMGLGTLAANVIGSVAKGAGAIAAAGAAGAGAAGAAGAGAAGAAGAGAAGGAAAGTAAGAGAAGAAGGGAAGGGAGSAFAGMSGAGMLGLGVGAIAAYLAFRNNPMPSFSKEQVYTDAGYLQRVINAVNGSEEDLPFAIYADVNGDGVIGQDDLDNLTEQMAGLKNAGQPGGKGQRGASKPVAGAGQALVASPTGSTGQPDYRARPASRSALPTATPSAPAGLTTQAIPQAGWRSPLGQAGYAKTATDIPLNPQAALPVVQPQPQPQPPPTPPTPPPQPPGPPVNANTGLPVAVSPATGVQAGNAQDPANVASMVDGYMAVPGMDLDKAVALVGQLGYTVTSDLLAQLKAKYPVKVEPPPFVPGTAGQASEPTFQPGTPVSTADFMAQVEMSPGMSVDDIVANLTSRGLVVSPTDIAAAKAKKAPLPQPPQTITNPQPDPGTRMVWNGNDRSIVSGGVTYTSVNGGPWTQNDSGGSGTFDFKGTPIQTGSWGGLPPPDQQAGIVPYTAPTQAQQGATAMSSRFGILPTVDPETLAHRQRVYTNLVNEGRTPAEIRTFFLTQGWGAPPA